jgi:hypothetical protein
MAWLRTGLLLIVAAVVVLSFLMSALLMGHTFSFSQVVQICSNPQGGPHGKDRFIACLQHRGLSEMVLYQPVGRFWLFQGIETAIFLGLGAVLLGVTV